MQYEWMLCNFAIKTSYWKALKRFQNANNSVQLQNFYFIERYKKHYDFNKYLVQNDVHNNYNFVVFLIGYLVILEKEYIENLSSTKYLNIDLKRKSEHKDKINDK